MSPSRNIILDEFHRCGAQMWDQGGARLVAANPAAKVLELAATSVRHLDNQRDMADELFGGDVASEMSLIVRWEQNYLEALRCYRERGDLDVPVEYRTETGFNLGA